MASCGQPGPEAQDAAAVDFEVKASILLVGVLLESGDAASFSSSLLVHLKLARAAAAASKLVMNEFLALVCMAWAAAE